MRSPVGVHRRRAAVVVSTRPRAPAAWPERRRHLPTIPGLGDDPPRATLPDIEATPVSGVRPRAVPVAHRPRFSTLLDGVHDDLARAYREEADRLLASGALRSPRPTT